jgi:hypothetical protein
MRKLLAPMVVATAILAMLAGSLESRAQSKKTAAKTGTIELIESKDGKYRFNVRDGEGKYLAGSLIGHETEKEARAAVEELKKVLADAAYVSKKSGDEKKEEKSKDKTKAKDK